MRNTREALDTGRRTASSHLSTRSSNHPLPPCASWQETTTRSNLLTQPLVARTDAAACSLGSPSSLSSSRRCVIVGGQGLDGTPLSSVELVEWALSRSWRLAPLQQARIGCGVAHVKGVVYCLGGLGVDHNGETTPVVLNSVEALPALHGPWQALDTTRTSLVMPRWGAAVVTLQKFIFVLGGRNAAWQETSSAEVGEFTNNSNNNNDDDDDDRNHDLTFSKMPYALKTKRFAATAVAVSPHAFLVVGGFDGKDWTGSCCLYDISESLDDPRDGQWRNVPDMPVPVDFPQAVLLDSLPGGMSGVENNDDDSNNNGPYVVVSGSGGVCVQIFHIATETWTVVEQGEQQQSPLASLVFLCGSETIVSWGRDHIATLEWTAPPSSLTDPPSNARAPAQSYGADNASTTASTEKQDRLFRSNIFQDGAVYRSINSQDEVFVVQDAEVVPLHSHSQTSHGSGSSTLRHSNNALLTAPPPGGRLVNNQDCLVEGEMARYSGPLNEQGQRHGKGFLIWADEGRYWPKQVSKNSYYEGEFVQDSRTGKGIFFFHKEDRVYSGSFTRGVLNDTNGQLFDGRRGLEYTGGFRKGTPSGEGQCTYNNTKQTWKGRWKYGKPLQGEWRDAHGNIIQAGNGPWNDDLAID